jgi:hypothetical protein
MGTGDNTTTWGGITNVNLGTTIEEAIVGSADVLFTTADVTLSLSNDNASQNTRNMRLKLTGTPASDFNLIIPKTAGTASAAFEKPYIINNTTGRTITVKTSTQVSGIAIPTGKTIWVYADGTNVVDVVTHLTSLTLGTALPVASGGTGVNASSGASSVVLRDASQNITINNIYNGYTAIVTAAGTTTLTVTSPYYIYFTGTTTQTLVMPVTSTLALGLSYHIANNSTGNITVNSSGGSLIGTILPGTTIHITCVDTAVTTAAGWDFGFTDFGTITGTGAVVLAASPTFTGTLTCAALSCAAITSTGAVTTNTSLATSSTATVSLIGTGAIAIGATSGTNDITVGQSTGAQTLNLATGATLTATTKTINIGTTGVSGSTTAINIGSAVSGATNNLTINGTLTSSNVAAGVGYKGVPQSANTTPAVSDIGKHLYVSAGFTISASVFSPGDTFVVVNSTTSAITITQGTNVSLRLAGSTAAAASRTVSGYGMASVLCVVGGANPVFMVSGAGVS